MSGRQGRRSRRAERTPRMTRSTESYRHLENPYQPPLALSLDQVEHIHRSAMSYLGEHGMRVLMSEARSVLASAGAIVDDDHMVRLDPEMVQAALESAPSSFEVEAPNPARNLTLGGASVNFFPVGGPPFVSDLAGGRRSGTFADFCRFADLNQSFDVLHSNSPWVEATDVPTAIRHLETTRVQLTHTDKVPYVYARGRATMDDCIQMICIVHGIDIDELSLKPRMWSNINTNSPLQLDDAMGAGIIDFARLNQPVIMTPFTLAGAMAPVTLAGALVLQHIEALFAITLAQTVRSGAPVVYGAFTSNVDMKSGAPAFGTPEAMKGAFASGQLARRAGLPWRSSASSTSNAPDAQGGYETMINMYGALMGGADVILHSAGWQEGGLTASFEKFVLDCEMLQILAEAMKPLVVDDDELALDAIAEVGPGGHFFAVQHTLDRYETAFYDPIVFTRSNYEQWVEDGSHEADSRAAGVVEERLASHRRPALDEAVASELDEFVAKRSAEGGAEPY